MSPHLVLLLILLGPGSSLQLRGAWEDGAQGAPGPALARGPRQAAPDDDFEEDYVPEVTDPPEILENITSGAALSTKGSALGQRGSTRAGAPEPASVGAATRASAGTQTGGTAELASQGAPATADLATREAPPAEEALSVQLAATEAPSPGPIATEAETRRPAATKEEATPPAVSKAEATPPAVSKAEATPPAVSKAEATPTTATKEEATPTAGTKAEATPTAGTKAEATPTAGTKAEATPPASTKAEATPPASTKAEATPPAATNESSAPASAAEESTPPAATAEALDPNATVALASIPATIAAAFLVPSVTYKGATETASNSADISAKKGQLIPTGAPMPPTPTGAPDSIPVRQCLLAIFILALVATIFLVCTVVLAVRLSRKSHMYPVRNYSPTEMVCISALLPDGGEGAPATTNGDLLKHQGPKAEPGDDHDGDNLTLHSFLP